MQQSINNEFAFTFIDLLMGVHGLALNHNFEDMNPGNLFNLIPGDFKLGNKVLSNWGTS